MKELQAGDICYAENDIHAACGKLLVHKGAIIKIHKMEIDGVFKVFLSALREKYHDWTIIPNKSKLIPANHLQEYYDAWVRNVSEIKDFANHEN